MKKSILGTVVLLAWAGMAVADEAPPVGWTGVGELGLAISRGNARSETVNAKLAFDFADEQFKHNVYANIVRNKGEVVVAGVEEFELSANRFELGASSGYKLSDRSYLSGSLRYENDDFAAFEHQTTVAVSYGYEAIKSEQTKLNLEIGPGFRRAKLIGNGTESNLIVRGFADYAHQLTETTQLIDTFLVEAGSDNTSLQNDLGVAVKVSDALALKTTLQIRHNTDVSPGNVKTDRLLTTNLVYSF
jgi:putative salt-induced outer membrane protein